MVANRAFFGNLWQPGFIFVAAHKETLYANRFAATLMPETESNSFPVKCRCQHCSTALEFAANQAGQTIACPNCGTDTTLYVPPTPAEKPVERQHVALTPENLYGLKARLRACRDCGSEISKRAVICPNCGMVPDLGRIGWYVFVVLGVVALIDLIIWVAVNGVLEASK